jgi:pimeloyl-ACP methyl ester carboxylesterase
MSYVEVAPNVDLFYQDWGTGSPVVFIHGWPLNHEMWEYQLTELPRQGLRCIAYDRRGFGKSSKPWEPYDYDTLAADLKAVLEALDLRNVTLVGFSMGGGEVVRYLSRYGSERVAKAVLLGAVTPFLLKTPDHPDGVDQSVFDGMLEKIRDDRPAFSESFGLQFFGVSMLKNPVSQALLDWVQALALQGSPKATLDCVHSFSATDFRADMARIQVPTLIIHGDNDRIVPIEVTGAVAANMIPGAQYVVYEGAPHGFFYTDREKLNRDLLAFVQQPAPAGAGM